MTKPYDPAGVPPRKWAARCECYNGHASASGRCTARNVTDPTTTASHDAVACEECRAECMKGVRS